MIINILFNLSLEKDTKKLNNIANILLNKIILTILLDIVAPSKKMNNTSKIIKLIKKKK